MTDLPITIHYQQMEEWLNDRKAVFARKYKKPYQALVGLAPRLVQLVQYDIPALQRQIKKESAALVECHRICDEAELSRSKMLKRQEELLVEYELFTNESDKLLSTTTTSNNNNNNSNKGNVNYNVKKNEVNANAFESDVSALFAEFDLDAALDTRIMLARNRLAVAMMDFVREHVVEFSGEYNNIVKPQLDEFMGVDYDAFANHFPWLHRLLQELNLPLKEVMWRCVHATNNTEIKFTSMEEIKCERTTDEERLDMLNAESNNLEVVDLPSIDWGDGDEIATHVDTLPTSEKETTIPEKITTVIPTIMNEWSKNETLANVTAATTYAAATNNNNNNNNSSNTFFSSAPETAVQDKSTEIIEIQWDATVDDTEKSPFATLDTNCVTIDNANNINNEHTISLNENKCIIEDNKDVSTTYQNTWEEQKYVDIQLPQSLSIAGVQYVSIDLSRSHDRSSLLTELQAMKCFCEVRHEMGELRNSARLKGIEAFNEMLTSSKDAEFVRMVHNYRTRESFVDKINYFSRTMSAAVQRQISHLQKIDEVEMLLKQLEPQLTQLCNSAKRLRDEAIAHVQSMFPDRTVIIAGDINKYLVYCNE